jgi:hypothetical protein
LTSISFLWFWPLTIVWFGPMVAATSLYKGLHWSLLWKHSMHQGWTSNRRWWTSVADLCGNLFTSTGYECRLYCLGTFYCCWTCMYSFSLIYCVNTWLKSFWRNGNMTRLPIPVVLCFEQSPCSSLAVALQRTNSLGMIRTIWIFPSESCCTHISASLECPPI